MFCKKGGMGRLLSLLISTSHTTVYNNVYLICIIGVTGMEFIGVAFFRFIAFSLFSGIFKFLSQVSEFSMYTSEA